MKLERGVNPAKNLFYFNFRIFNKFLSSVISIDKKLRDQSIVYYYSAKKNTHSLGGKDSRDVLPVFVSNIYQPEQFVLNLLIHCYLLYEPIMLLK